MPSAIIAVLLVVAVLVGLGLGHGVWRTNSSAPLPSGSGSTGGNNSGGLFGGNGAGGGNGSGSGNGGGSGGGSNSAQIAQRAQGALVDINTDLGYQSGGQAAGTGIVMTSNGEVLTNNHVIAGATQINVTDIGNGRTYPAVVVGYDRTHDIAVVQMQGASGLQTAAIGDSTKVSVGDAIIGIGNAGGVGGTPSSASGTITALNQSITATDQSDGSSEQLAGLIEVDADIQPGDSGGALVNAQAQVIGVDTAASAGFSFQTSGGQGFAIPINQAVSIARQIESGRATTSIHLGQTAFLGVLIENNAGTGATLNSVVPSGPAAKAGLVGGDVITSLNGATVDSSATLTRLMGKYHPGDKVALGWTDQTGQNHTSVVSLALGPAA
jgi:S1-C subfamily serine protease